MRRKGIATLAVAAAGLLSAVGLAVAPASAAIPLIDATTFKAAQTSEIPVGFAGGVAGDLTIGTSSTMFQAGDTITVSLDDSDSVANCFDGLGFRDYVAFASLPVAHIPGPTASVQVNMGSSPLCASQEGGTQLDTMTVNVLIGGPGPITVTNIRYTGGSNGTLNVVVGTGPVPRSLGAVRSDRPSRSDRQHVERVAHHDFTVGRHGELSDPVAVAAGRDLAPCHQRVGCRRVRPRRHCERRLPRHLGSTATAPPRASRGRQCPLRRRREGSVATASTVSRSKRVPQGRARA